MKAKKHYYAGASSIYSKSLRDISVELDSSLSNINYTISLIHIKLLDAMFPEERKNKTMAQKFIQLQTCRPEMDELLSIYIRKDASNPSLSESRRYLDIGETL